MANLFKALLDSMRFDEDYDDEDDFEEIVEERESRRKPRRSRKDLEEEDIVPVIPQTSQVKKEKVTKADRTSNKVVPMRISNRDLEVCVMKPSTFEESQEIGDLLLSGKPTVINLEGFDDKVAQRIMDFVSGCVYAINGKLHRISNSIFIVSPDNVDISGDFFDLIQKKGFEPPTFDNSF